jgi:hypothetical protein
MPRKMRETFNPANADHMAEIAQQIGKVAGKGITIVIVPSSAEGLPRGHSSLMSIADTVVSLIGHRFSVLKQRSTDAA